MSRRGGVVSGAHAAFDRRLEEASCARSRERGSVAPVGRARASEDAAWGARSVGRPLRQPAAAPATASADAGPPGTVRSHRGLRLRAGSVVSDSRPLGYAPTNSGDMSVLRATSADNFGA